MKTRFKPLKPKFQFAGFTFPRYLANLPPRSIAKRKERYSDSYPCGDYQLCPDPTMAGKGTSFYLCSDFQPRLRWNWCDEISGVRIRHRGWNTDDFCGHGDKIRGLVMRLPKSRGFLAGWSMGEGMASFIECNIYDDEQDAAYAADSLAEGVADKEREYQRQCAREEEEERDRKESEEIEAAFTF